MYGSLLARHHVVQLINVRIEACCFVAVRIRCGSCRSHSSRLLFAFITPVSVRKVDASIISRTRLSQFGVQRLQKHSEMARVLNSGTMS